MPVVNLILNAARSLTQTDYNVTLIENDMGFHVHLVVFNA